jgi:hypothetical protein
MRVSAHWAILSACSSVGYIAFALQVVTVRHYNILNKEPDIKW